MKLLGVELRVPSFWEFTSATILAIGLGLLVSGIAVRVDPGLLSRDIVSLLLVVWVATVGTHVGLDLRHGWRAGVLQCAGGALLVGAVQALA